MKFTVPKGQIRFLVGRVHCGTPDAEIVADMNRRIDQMAAKPASKGGKVLTAKQRRQIIDYALKEHHENRVQYCRVMRGNVGMGLLHGRRSYPKTRWAKARRARR